MKKNYSKLKSEVLLIETEGFIAASCDENHHHHHHDHDIGGYGYYDNENEHTREI